MIRQKDVEKCSFFTTTGGDIWKTKKVRLITEVELVNCETGRSEICRAGEQSAERFIAIAIPTVRRGTKDDRGRQTNEGRRTKGGKKKRKIGELTGGGGVNAPPTTPKPKIKPTGQGPALRGDRRGCRKGKPPSSQYLGVTVHKTKNSGPRYYAQSSRNGKFKGLGVHKVEELAAAAVQEHLGNKDEAERLRKIAEQKTDTAIKELKGQVGTVRFLCSGCGADYEEKPGQCKKCGGGGFEKIWRN